MVRGENPKGKRGLASPVVGPCASDAPVSRSTTGSEPRGNAGSDSAGLWPQNVMGGFGRHVLGAGGARHRWSSAAADRRLGRAGPNCSP